MLYNKNYTTVKSKTLPLHPATGMSFPKILLRKKKAQTHLHACAHLHAHTHAHFCI